MIRSVEQRDLRTGSVCSHFTPVIAVSRLARGQTDLVPSWCFGRIATGLDEIVAADPYYTTPGVRIKVVCVLTMRCGTAGNRYVQSSFIR
jgi:hypothetical protein